MELSEIATKADIAKTNEEVRQLRRMVADLMTGSEKQVLSLRDVCRRYGVSRASVKADIATGRIHATERKCRGGWLGQFVPRDEAERLYSGLMKIS